MIMWSVYLGQYERTIPSTGNDSIYISPCVGLVQWDLYNIHWKSWASPPCNPSLYRIYPLSSIAFDIMAGRTPADLCIQMV